MKKLSIYGFITNRMIIIYVIYVIAPSKTTQMNSWILMPAWKQQEAKPVAFPLQPTLAEERAWDHLRPGNTKQKRFTDIYSNNRDWKSKEFSSTIPLFFSTPQSLFINLLFNKKRGGSSGMEWIFSSTHLSLNLITFWLTARHIPETHMSSEWNKRLNSAALGRCRVPISYQLPSYQAPSDILSVLYCWEITGILH